MPRHPFVLIAFKFPPHAEVGSRRWTKLSKHLAERGHRIHVVTVNWNTEGPNALAEVSHPNITIHRLPALGPKRHHRLRRATEDPAQTKQSVRRFLKRIRLILKSVLTKVRWMMISRLTRWGLMEDTRFWGLVMVPFTRRLMRREGIRCVVTTGPPFMANWWASRLKQTSPDMILIQDMRDPWAALPSSVYTATQHNKPNHTRRLEAEALDAADQVVTVTEGYEGLLARNTSTPVEVISNGFDASELPDMSELTERQFKLVYSGSVAGGRKEAARALLDTLRKDMRELPGISVEFWGPPLPLDICLDYQDLMEVGILKACGRVSGTEIMRIIAHEAFACIQLTAREMPEALSTKVYDYAQARRPILCINYGGEIDSLMEKHHLGWSVNGDDSEAIRSALQELYALWRADPSAQADSMGVEEYDYRNIAERYSRLIDGLAGGPPEEYASA